MEAIGKTKDDFNYEDFTPFIYGIVNSVLLCWVMAKIFSEVTVDTFKEGIKYSFLIWIAYFGSTYAIHLAFGQFPIALNLDLFPCSGSNF